MSNQSSKQRTVLQELVNTAAEVYRISERATLPWHALSAALKDARAVLAQPDETEGDARRTADYWKAEHLAGNEVIAEVREILGEFNSEDVQVMARRAIERIRELEGSRPETSRELAPSEAASFDKALTRSPRRVEWVFDVKVTVCSECLCASCWQGIFYCDKSKEASTTTKTVGQLRALGPLESPEHWFRSPHTGVISEMDLAAYQSAVKSTGEQS